MEWLDTAVEKDDTEVLEPGSSSRAFEEDEVIPVSLLQSEKLPKERLWRELIQISLDDNLWHQKSWDENDVTIVKIHCGKCVKDFGSTARDYNSHAISNFFMNFRKTHLHTTLHIRNFCQRQGLPYTDHPNQ